MTAAAGRALNSFRRKCRDFKVELHTFSVQLNTVTSKEAAQQIIHSMSEEWERLSSSYGYLEYQYPEVRVLEPQEYDDPVCTEREALYEDLRQSYMNAKVKAVNMITKLRILAAPDPVPVPQPEPAQLASSMKVQRNRVVTELKRKIRILQNKADASTVPKYLTGSSELETLCANVRCLWNYTKEMSDKIKIIDPKNQGEYV